MYLLFILWETKNVTYGSELILANLSNYFTDESWHLYLGESLKKVEKCVSEKKESSFGVSEIKGD